MKMVYLGLGTNLGNRVENLEKAIYSLSQIFKILKVSKIYETEPWGYKDQANFLNMVILINCKTIASELLFTVKKIEKEIGREKTFRFGPRLIDIDILYFGNDIIQTAELTVPHPEIINRPFVLVPLNEIAKELVHTILLKNNYYLLNKITDGGVSIYDQQPFENITFFNPLP